MNGVKLHWDIVTIVGIAMACVTIASFHDGTAVIATGAIGSIASTTMIQLLNLKRTNEVQSKLVENTAITKDAAESATAAAHTAASAVDKAAQTADKAAIAIEKISDKLKE